MAPEDVARAIMRLADKGLQRQVVRGEFDALTDLDLSDREKAMLIEGLESPRASDRAGGAVSSQLCMNPFYVDGRRGLLFDAARYAKKGVIGQELEADFDRFV